MKINEIVEMRYVGRAPGVSTVDRSNPAIKAAIMKKAAWHDKFLKSDEREKFTLAYNHTKNSPDTVEVTLIDPTTGFKEVLSNKRIESFNPQTGQIIFLKKSNIQKTMLRVFANTNNAVYKGRQRNSTGSPFKYMFEIPVNSSYIKKEPNPDFKSVRTGKNGPRHAFHQF